MHQVHLELNDHVYNAALERATAAGFDSVAEYAAEVLEQELRDPEPDLDRLFTPVRLAHIDDVVNKVKAGGKTHSLDEVRESLRLNRSEWIAKNS